MCVTHCSLSIVRPLYLLCIGLVCKLLAAENNSNQAASCELKRSARLTLMARGPVLLSGLFCKYRQLLVIVELVVYVENTILI